MVKNDQQTEAELPAGIALAWGRVSAPRRGPRPGQTLEGIVEVGIELADTEGIPALSLPRIAAVLGLSRNALYRYVRSKDELLRLIYDVALGSPPKSLSRSGNWRKRARAWTLAVIRGYREHLWLLDVPIAGPPSTPHVLEWLEALLQAMSDCGLSGQDCLRCALLLDGYARSVVRLWGDVSAGGQTQKQWAAAKAFIAPLLHKRHYPILASIIASERSAIEEPPVDDVEFGLNRILDGIDSLIAARKT